MIESTRLHCQPKAPSILSNAPACGTRPPSPRRLAVVSVLLVGLLAGAVAAAGPPPVVFQVQHERGVPIARLCERVWAEHGPSLADAILPRGVVADTVVCMVLDTATFQQYFAHHLPDWGVGVALPHGRLVALDLDRTPRVGPGPEAVFMHEMAHALLFQGAGEARLPTWLHEGVAMRAAGQWRLTDTMQVVLSGRLPSLGSLAGPFPHGDAAAQQAYRTSLLAVNWLEREHGPGAVARIVAASRRLGDFRQGFFEATGEEPEQFARRFGGAMQLRFGWVLLLFRWPTIFVLMALLFTVGAVRKIVRNRRDLRRLDAEDDDRGYGEDVEDIRNDHDR